MIGYYGFDNMVGIQRILDCSQVFLAYIPLYVLVILFYRTPKFEDTFFIHEELKYIIIVLCFNFIWSSVFALTLFSDEDHTLLIYINAFCGIMVGTMLFLAMLVSLFWVNFKCKNIIKNNEFKVIKSKTTEYVRHNKVSKSPEQTNYTNNSSLKPILGSPNSSKASMSIYNLPLKDILKHDQLFQSFMNVLSIELSNELLLALIELTQYYEYIHKYLRTNNVLIQSDINKPEPIMESISFPDNIPQSYIVHQKSSFNSQNPNTLNVNNDNTVSCSSPSRIHINAFLKECKQKAYELYKKYITKGATLQVNISYKSRKKLDIIMKKDMKGCDLNELLFIFDDVCNEIYSLMNDSYQRFQCSGNYIALANSVLDV